MNIDGAEGSSVPQKHKKKRRARAEIGTPADYRDYDTNWLSEIVTPPFPNIKSGGNLPMIEEEGRVNFLISLAGKAAPEGAENSMAVGMGRAINLNAV